MTGSCSNCGADLQAAAEVCPKCGHAVEHDPYQVSGAGLTDLSSNGDHADSAPTGGNLSNTDPSEPITDTADEQMVIWEVRYSPKSVAGRALAAALLAVIATMVAANFTSAGRALFIGTVCAVVFCGGIGLYLAFRRLNASYKLTDEWFEQQTGLLKLVAKRIEVIRIDDVALSQGPIERVLGTGTIKIMSNDDSHPELFMYGIGNVVEVAKRIDNARREQRRKRGLYIELT